MDTGFSEKRSLFNKLQPVQVLALGFAGVILIGALLLMLPIASRSGQVTPFIDTLFTSTSAVCVTGLVVVDTGTYWTTFGQVIIILLIQVGGLGFMTFATMFAILLGKRITLKERLIMQEAYNSFDLQGMVRLALKVMGITFTIEASGAFLLSLQFVKDYGWLRGVYYGVFHSISAFCNAGFDLLGEYRSITIYNENPLVVLAIGCLIVLGGLGFAVIAEVISFKRINKFSLHTKVVLLTTAVLIFGGAGIIFALEYSNPKTLGDLSFLGKITNSIFASITPRTAGYNSIPTEGMTIGGQFLTVILMFIGASPGSTGGGIKTSTAMLIFATVIAVIRGREDTEIFKKRINKSLVYRALAITIISFMLVTVVTLILSITQQGKFIEFLYESTSAFGTVGLTLGGFTQRLNDVGKVVVLLTMYAGRVGPLTLALAFAHRLQTESSAIKYPEDKVLVG